MRLAVTAALEHYTATFAEIILTSDEAQELIGYTEVRPILLWHALEECEHKAVAFDVYETVGGRNAPGSGDADRQPPLVQRVGYPDHPLSGR